MCIKCTENDYVHMEDEKGFNFLYTKVEFDDIEGGGYFVIEKDKLPFLLDAIKKHIEK